MDKKMNQHGDLSQRVGDQLGRDLKRLFGSSSPVSKGFDTRVMAHYRRSQTRRLRLRWVRYAAAAIVLLTVGLFMVQNHSSLDPQVKVGALPMDIDRDGRVNILDALRLAQQLPTAQIVSSQWDFNGDGTIDRQDVDLVAYRAVRLSAQEVL